MPKAKYETHIAPRLDYIKSMCRDGLTEVEMCKRLGVGVSSFNRYKNDYKELWEALKDGKEIADYAVENSLYKRALGYDAIEITRQWKKVLTTKEDGTVIVENKLIVTKEVTKHIAPEVAAIIFWLKNRKADKWRDKHDIDLGGNPFEGMEIKELNANIAEIDKRIRSITGGESSTSKV